MARALTDDELRRLVSEGLSQREIARRTGLSRSTLYARFQLLGLVSTHAPSTVHPDTPDRSTSTVDRPPSTHDALRTDLQAALTASLQPVLARLDALETGLAQPRTVHRPPSTIAPDTVDHPPGQGPPSTVHPDTWEFRQLKHSVRWTIYVPPALKEEIQRQAKARHQHPSFLLQELLWQALKTPS